MSSLAFERPSVDDITYPSISRMTDTFPAYLIEEVAPHSQEARLIRDNVKQLHTELARAVTDDIDGLNLAAINAYFERSDLSPEPYYVISADELADVAAELKRSYVTMLGDSHGLFTPFGRMSLIKRDHDREAIFGTAVTERVVAHELGHSSSEHDHIEFSGDSPREIIRNTHMPRIGNRYIPYAPAGHPERGNIINGAFPEEAHAELTGSDYLHQTYGPVFEDPHVGFDLELEDEPLWLPARHVNCVPGNEGKRLVTFNTPALAAYAYEILNWVDEDHAIIDLMTKGRSDVTAYLEIDQRLDAMGVDNLSQVMQEVVYSQGGFLAGLQIAEFVAHEHGITTRPQSVPMPKDVYRPSAPAQPYDHLGVFEIDPVFEVMPSRI